MRGIGTQSYVIHHFTDEKIEIQLKPLGEAGRTLAEFQRLPDGVRRTKQAVVAREIKAITFDPDGTLIDTRKRFYARLHL